MNTDEKKAVIYARWLAERDKVPLPEAVSISIEWAEPRMRSGIRLARIKAVTFDGDHYAVTVKLPGWNYDPSPIEGPPVGEL